VAESQLAEVFERLRPLLEAHESKLVVLDDQPASYALGVPWIREDGYRGWFGAVKVGKRYVSYHLMPVYAHPELLDRTSDALRKRMQGKSCFNFTKVDETLFDELAGLTRRGLDAFAADGLLESR
jgi:hypothetical protein